MTNGKVNSIALCLNTVAKPRMIASIIMRKVLLHHVPLVLYMSKVIVQERRAKMAKATSFQGNNSSLRTKGFVKISINKAMHHFFPACLYTTVAEYDRTIANKSSWIITIAAAL